MEHESFENEETAGILNRYFVAVKVDREERPDIDAVYMSVCIGLTGSGGWPLTLFLTPEQQPFYAATYLPKSSRYGMTGLDELLTTIATVWATDRKELLTSAQKIGNYIKNQSKEQVSGTPSKELLSQGASYFKENFDKVNGGFGHAPKFPSPHNLLFLMKYAGLTEDKNAFDAAEKTLTQMYRGGIFDHIGGGFSRYSTDSSWLVPHFEKMLYDNALLTICYSKAFFLTGNPIYRYAAEKTISYVLRELTDEAGGFYCGQDADSEGEEGKYYVFTPEEIKEVFKNADADKFCRRFDITEAGNFEGKSIPNLLKNGDFAETDSELETVLERLYFYRKNRTKLHKDDKILLSWNALMIAALAKAYQVFGQEEYLAAAEKAAVFLEISMTGKGGRLFVRYREGQAAGEGKLDDYAFYAYALYILYEITMDVGYLVKCRDVTKLMTEHFFDKENGGFYLYADDGEPLITRPKEVYDGAVPSGNSVAAWVLVKLYHLTADPFFGKLSAKQMDFIAGNVEHYPAGYSFSLLAMIEVLYPNSSLICTGNDSTLKSQVKTFLKENRRDDIDVLIKTSENEKRLYEVAPFTASYPVPADGCAFYLCKNGACQTPVNSLEKLKI